VAEKSLSRATMPPQKMAHEILPGSSSAITLMASSMGSHWLAHEAQKCTTDNLTKIKRLSAYILVTIINVSKSKKSEAKILTRKT